MTSEFPVRLADETEEQYKKRLRVACVEESLKRNGYEHNNLMRAAEGLETVKKDEPNNLVVLSKEAQTKFESPDLLEHIKTELDKTHIGDDNLKMTTLLTCVSGLLKDPKQRKSIAHKGNTTTGKSNLQKTCIKNMPDDTYLSLTNVTQATIEDDIQGKRIIVIDEVNANRENGANKYLIEVIKQKSEGGTSSLKKDKRTDNKTARHEIGEQATILFGTTETNKDDELDTRFIVGTIKSEYKKIKSVNDKTCDTYSDMDKMLEDNSQEECWLKNGLTCFYHQEKQPLIVIPYLGHLKGQIDGQDIFDHSNPRSQRDFKRLVALTMATTYLFQLQRKKVEHKGQLFIISEIDDLINTLEFSTEFFNQSYSGLDARLTDVLRIMEELGSDWIARDIIQDKSGVSRNTIKNYCSTLAGEGLIEGKLSGEELNEETGLSIYNKNKIYYKRCQRGIKKPLIRCQISKLKEHLENKMKEKIDSFAFTNEEKDVKIEDIRVKAEEDCSTNEEIFKKIDTLLLTASTNLNQSNNTPNNTNDTR